MAERKERRKRVRVALSGTQIVRTHEGLEAHLLDLSLQGGRVAHFGILRPGARERESLGGRDSGGRRWEPDD